MLKNNQQKNVFGGLEETPCTPRKYATDYMRVF